MKVSYEGEKKGLDVVIASSSSSSSSSVAASVHKRQLARLDDSSAVNLTVNDSMTPDTPSHPVRGYVDSGNGLRPMSDEIYRYAHTHTHIHTYIQNICAGFNHNIYIYIYIPLQ